MGRREYTVIVSRKGAEDAQLGVYATLDSAIENIEFDYFDKGGKEALQSTKTLTGEIIRGDGVSYAIVSQSV